MKKNEIVRLEITDINSEGAGVGRIDGIVVFVPYALPNETVDALIIKVAKSYAVGKLQNVIIKNPMRKEPDCKYFYKCGGCDLQHIDYASQLKIKCESALKNIQKLSGQNLKINKVIGADKCYNYRNKAQFPVALGSDGRIAVGFFSPRSHRIVSLDSCMLQDDKCNSIISVIKDVIVKHSIPVYDESTHTGILRHIIARSSVDGLMIIIVTNSSKRLPDVLCEEIKHKLSSVTTIIQNINTEKCNVILGKRCITLSGDGFINDSMCDIRFRLRPLAFLQINREQASKLYNTVLELAELTGNETVFDAYCGIGVMSLMLAKKAKKLIGVEIVSEAIEAANESAKLNNITNAEFITGACEDVLPKLLKQGNKPDILVVDPPRAGCEETLLNAISEADINKIIYVSCNPATLARDIKILNEKGYTSSDVIFVDMFCQTKHVETVCLLSRR